MTTETKTLSAEQILRQAYELLIPKNMWTKDMWIGEPESKESAEQSYRVCSMGALLLVEHLYAGTDLYLDSDVDTDGETVYTPAEYHDADSSETAVYALLERDDEFAKATTVLASVVRELKGFHSHSDVDAVVAWNDDPDTTWDDVKSVFEEAVRRVNADQSAN